MSAVGLLTKSDSFGDSQSPNEYFGDMNKQTVGSAPGGESTTGTAPTPDKGCRARLKGNCQSVSTACEGGYVDNYCGNKAQETLGKNAKKCCLPVGKKCEKLGGKCITRNGTQAQKGGRYYTGLCPGPWNIQCYVPPGNK